MDPECGENEAQYSMALLRKSFYKLLDGCGDLDLSSLCFLFIIERTLLLPCTNGS